MSTPDQDERRGEVTSKQVLSTGQGNPLLLSAKTKVENGSVKCPGNHTIAHKFVRHLSGLKTIPGFIRTKEEKCVLARKVTTFL
jgi:hypothetical protein